MKYSYFVFLCTFLCGAIQLGVEACSYYERGLNENDKRIIVDKHNELRRKIARGELPGQPRGTNLKEIKYDETLAQTAQWVSDSCEFAHKEVHDGRWPNVGQNLYTSYSTAYDAGADWNSAIDAWSNEYRNYWYGGPVTADNGHYTQMVWADTEYIGCGYIYFVGSGAYSYQKLYTCNYGPAGNYIGQLPYAT